MLQSLKALLKKYPDLPAQTSLLGAGEDGLPVLLDLNDPRSGSLVVIGDEREEQLNLLRSAVASLAMRNSPRSVQFLIISCDPESWKKWINLNGYQRYCASIEGIENLDDLSGWIIRLGDWIEQRRMEDRSGPPLLLVFDTLSFLPRLAYDIRLNFEWMSKEGPAARIWPLAAISTDLADLLNNRHMLRAFRTRVLGFTEKEAFYMQMAGLSKEGASTFGEPGVFAVQLGEHWLRFRLAIAR